MQHAINAEGRNDWTETLQKPLKVDEEDYDMHGGSNARSTFFNLMLYDTTSTPGCRTHN